MRGVELIEKKSREGNHKRVGAEKKMSKRTKAKTLNFIRTEVDVVVQTARAPWPQLPDNDNTVHLNYSSFKTGAGTSRL